MYYFMSCYFYEELPVLKGIMCTCDMVMDMFWYITKSFNAWNVLTESYITADHSWQYGFTASKTEAIVRKGKLVCSIVCGFIVCMSNLLYRKILKEKVELRNYI